MQRDQTDRPQPGRPIDTARLVLRPPGRRDRAAMATLAERGRIMESLAALPDPFAGEAFAVVEKSSAKVIGSAVYGRLAERPVLTEITCWIGDGYRGLGYATEAAHAIIDRAFADPAMVVLWCSNRAMNAPARRVIEKCGFQFRATGMARSAASPGTIPVERFALERRNWLALRRWGSPAERKDGNGGTHNAAA